MVSGVTWNPLVQIVTVKPTGQVASCDLVNEAK
jgi:hypothetical protein